MSGLIVALALVHAPVRTRTVPARLPQEVEDHLSAVMLALYPKWEAINDATGKEPDGKIPRARLRDARAFDVSGRREWFVLVQTWQGDPCRHGKCPPGPGDLAVVQLDHGAITLVAVARGAVTFGDGAKPSIDPTARRLDRGQPLVGIRLDSGRGKSAQTVLELFRVDGALLRPVFRRRVRWRDADDQGKEVRCETTVVPDTLDRPPYALEVTDHCDPVDETAIEIWRWSDGGYVLHGPPSDVDQPDATADTDEDGE